MKRAVMMFMAISGSLLLGGCGPHWDDGERYGRDRDGGHDRGYDRGYNRGYDDDRGHDRRYDRRDDDQRYERYRDREDRDD
ncbi:hypothetical protein [Pseudomonas sp. TE12234]